jgi:hypothetical protein
MAKIQTLIHNLFISTISILAGPASPAEYTFQETDTGVAVKVDGQLFAEYVLSQANKPYLWPVYGPTGKQMTRAFPMRDVEGEVKDHYHHRGIFFGHQGIGGFDSWTEAGTYGERSDRAERLKTIGSCKHREFTEKTVKADGAVLASICDYLSPDGKKLLTEKRKLTFRTGTDVRTIDFDQELIATEGDVEFSDKKDAGLSIRVPTSMSITSKQGGKVVNSEGQLDKDAWSKLAIWVDYHGPVEGEHLGVAILSHPTSFRHPSRWHVRDYGLFTVNPFCSSEFTKALPDSSFVLKSGETIRLKHRLVFHKGDEQEGKISEEFVKYASEK